MNVNSAGNVFSFVFMPFNLVSMAGGDGHLMQSMVAIDTCGTVESSSFFGGARSKIQNAIASKTGIINIICMTLRGCMPANEVKAAYEMEPSTPAAPVPDDQAGITRLQQKGIKRKLVFLFDWKITCDQCDFCVYGWFKQTYLLNLAE